MYGRILIPCSLSFESGQDSPIQTDGAQLIRCLLYGKQEKFNVFNVTGSG